MSDTTITLRERLIGAWKLVSYVEQPVDGSAPFYPFGETPQGIRAELMPGVMLTPNVQYEIHPGTRGFPTSGREIGDPLVLGFKLTMDLGRVGGFARAPR